MDEHNSIREQALHLDDGETTQGECPWCGRTDSFYLTRTTNAIKYIDHSVNCGKRGVITSRPGDRLADVDVVKTTRKPKKIYKGELFPLDHKEQHFLWRRFGLGLTATNHMRYCEWDGRVYFPMLSMHGQVVQYIARYYPELAGGREQYGAKALVKWASDEPEQLLFPTLEVIKQVRETGKVLLVEDYVSAQRFNYQMGIPTCCLGGTTLYQGHIDTLLRMGVQSVALLLDGDAITKAVKIKRSVQLCFHVKLCTLSPHDPDPKDMSHDELEEKFANLRRWYERE